MTLEDAAKDVIKAWEKWCDADGWDNREYDDFSAALQDLANYLKKGANAQEREMSRNRERGVPDAHRG